MPAPAFALAESTCPNTAQPCDPCSAPSEAVVVLAYLVDDTGRRRLVCLPMVGLVRKTGIAVPARESKHLRDTLTAWARARRLWSLDPEDGRAYPFSALRVFEPLELLEKGCLAVADPAAPGTTEDSCAAPDTLRTLRLAVAPLQEYREAALDVLNTLDAGYRDDKGMKPQRGPRSRRLERLLNITFEDLRWLRRAERLLCESCPEPERPFAAAGVRHSLHTAALRYLGPRVTDPDTWLTVLERARLNEGLLQRLVELDGFLDSDLAEAVLTD